MSRHGPGRSDRGGPLEDEHGLDTEDEGGVDTNLGGGDALEESIGSAEGGGRDGANGAEQAGNGSANLREGAGEGALGLVPELDDGRVENAAEQATDLADLLLGLVVQSLRLDKKLRVVSIP